jgi:hypothetical protein
MTLWTDREALTIIRAMKACEVHNAHPAAASFALVAVAWARQVDAGQDATAARGAMLDAGRRLLALTDPCDT